MFDLKEEILDDLHKLNDIRERAKELRERGLRSLKKIKDLSPNCQPSTDEHAWKNEEMSKEEIKELKKYLENWTCSSNNVEVSLLVKAQNHQNLSENEEYNENAEAGSDLSAKLENINLEDLFPSSDNSNSVLADPIIDLTSTVPVLLAARALQALTTRSKTVFSKASMFCYFRIIHELYSAAPPDSAPDWIIGAARAGTDGRTSAFITSECIRAVFAFEDAIRRTSEYFEQTLAFYRKYWQLKTMLENVGIMKGDTVEIENDIPEHPLRKWADQEIERMYLDWYISTNQRNGAIALYYEDEDQKERDEKSDRNLFSVRGEINISSVGKAFSDLQTRLKKTIERALGTAPEETKENEQAAPAIAGIRLAHQEIKTWIKKMKGKPSRTKVKLLDAHSMALSVIETIHANAEKKCYRECQKRSITIEYLLEYLLKQFKSYPNDIHQRLEPTKRYVRAVLDHELAIAHSRKRFDAGELVFAATAYGTAMKWPEKDEKLIEACKFLTEDLPESGRLVTNQPFHATKQGYKLMPIGCEMTRHFAKLMHRTQYEFKPGIAEKMLNIFTGEQLLPHKANDEYVGWNFENAPKINHPSVWVTAVSVQALDRIVRMLNDRINEIVFKHFKVIKPKNSYANLSLNDLFYPGHGLTRYNSAEESTGENFISIAICLEQMRAHVMRASLPDKYKGKVFSAIFYGPPGTGKTSLLEALARSSKMPLLMLSPSDLIVQGREQLEGRARAVFDALSMLSQTVILLDEFEPVLGRREPKEGDQQGSGKNTGDLIEAAKAIREGETSMLNFLLTGMLPKLVSLHEAAKKQSLVYCLATNRLEKIDDAAKRSGRFDVHQGIYKPDPVARAGTFLFNLHLVAENRGYKLSRLLSEPSNRVAEKFAEIIAASANENAGELSRRLIKPPKLEIAKDGINDKRWLSFNYILEKDVDNQLEKEIMSRIRKNYDNFKEMEKELNNMKNRLDENERREREGLLHFEKHLNERVKNLNEETLKNFLKNFLTPDNNKIMLCERCGGPKSKKLDVWYEKFGGKRFMVKDVEIAFCERSECKGRSCDPETRNKMREMIRTRYKEAEEKTERKDIYIISFLNQKRL